VLATGDEGQVAAGDDDTARPLAAAAGGKGRLRVAELGERQTTGTGDDGLDHAASAQRGARELGRVPLGVFVDGQGAGRRRDRHILQAVNRASHRQPLAVGSRANTG